MNQRPREVLDREVFPKESSFAERLRYLLNYAVLAPSSHNSQPWEFRVEEDGVELYADRTRALAVADPKDRELIMSCGAALLTLRIAMRRFALVPRVQLFPRPHIRDLMARIEVESREPADEETLALFEAITRRHTNRQAFEDRIVPADTIERLSWAAEHEGASLRFMTAPEQKADIAQLVAAADRVQGSDASFRRELADWVRSDDSHASDGIPGFAVGVEG